MKRLLSAILVTFLFFLFACGGSKTTVKAEKTTTDSQPQKQKNYSVYGEKLDDTAYSNVIQIFREALTTEKESPIPKNIYASGEATVLLIKFFKENLSVKRYGFTREDIETYKNFARKKFSAVLEDKNSTEELKAGAQEYLNQIQNM